MLTRTCSPGCGRVFAMAALGLLELAARGAPEAAPLWSTEAETPTVRHQAAVTVVEDPTASAGKALLMPTEGVSPYNVVNLSIPNAGVTPGRYRLDVHLRLSDAADIGKGLRVDVNQDPATLLGYAVAYGLHVKGTAGYAPFHIPFDLTAPPAKPLAVALRWTDGAGTPSARLDAFHLIRVGDLPVCRIREVWPDRLRYLSAQHGTITVKVDNLAATPQAARVRLELFHDLAAPRPGGEQVLDLGPGESKEAVFEFRNPGLLFGYAARATLEAGGQPVDEKEEYFTVHDSPWAVAAGARDQEPPKRLLNWWGTYYGIGAADSLIEEAALAARREYTTCFEFFSWSPGECFDMAPEKEFWIRGNGGNLLRSKREIQRAVAALKRHGIGCITYIAYQAMGERTLEILQQKPEWFTYSGTTGDLLEFYTVHELEKRKTFWAAFDWTRYQTDGNPLAPGWQDTPEQWARYKDFWQKPAEECRKLGVIGYFCPNYAVPEVVDFCADQAIASSRMFGWDGLRWDCGHLNPGPVYGAFSPFYDFQGRPQARTPAEMEEKTVGNLQRLKSRIRAQLPNFVIGTNFGSWMETHSYPKMTAELARDGGWLLDEVCYGYNRPQSPYHFWDAYYAIMADEGEHVTSLGGHYNPFAFNRNGGKYPVDGLYETIFRLAGRGHPQSAFYNSQLPAGNFGQFAVRFGRFLFDPAIRRLEPAEPTVRVTSPAPLWWQKTVGVLRDPTAEYLLVHLINPPVAKEAETDPMSRLNAPVTDVQLSVVVPAGRTKATAWVLTAEAWEPGATPQVRAVPVAVAVADGRAAVRVPVVLFWKLLALRFE